jgi:hypothetical protein
MICLLDTGFSSKKIFFLDKRICLYYTTRAWDALLDEEQGHHMGQPNDL